MLDGSRWVASGIIQVSAADDNIHGIAPAYLPRSETDGETGFSQYRLDDQLLLSDRNSLLTSFSDQKATGAGVSLVIGVGALAYQLGMKGDSHSSSNIGPVQSQQNPSVTKGEDAMLFTTIANENRTFEFNVSQDGAAIHNSAIGITRFDVGSDSRPQPAKGPSQSLRSSICKILVCLVPDALGSC